MAPEVLYGWGRVLLLSADGRATSLLPEEALSIAADLPTAAATASAADAETPLRIAAALTKAATAAAARKGRR